MKKLKSAIALLLSIVLIFSCAGCTLDTDPYQSDTTSQSESTSTAVEDTSSTSSETTSNDDSSTATSDTTSPPKGSGTGTGTATKVDISSIPAYSGRPYAIINNNVPNFSASELTTKGYEAYSSLDGLGRTQMCIASVGRDTMPKDGEERQSISNIKPTGWVQAQYDCVSGGWLYNRCHLIGWQLSAENANRCNLITGTKYLNINGMLPFENMVADYIKETNGHVAYRITPVYEGNNLLASGVQMEAYSIDDDGESICFNVYCYNVQPEITINYATGSSTGPSNKQETSPPTQTPSVENTGDSSMVWIPKSGSKYHSKSSCSNMKNPSQVTEQEAIQRGYEPCKKCY